MKQDKQQAFTVPGSRLKKKVRYNIGKCDKKLKEMEFEASLEKPFSLRINNSFIKTYKPVLDDKPYRAFDRTSDYREWCKKNLPYWLGYSE